MCRAVLMADAALSPQYPGEAIVVMDGFISEQEGGQLLDELEYVFWKPSLTYQRQVDDTYRNVLADTRVSETAHQDFFSDEVAELLAAIEARLTAYLGVDPAHLEWWQATRYPIGGRFDYHLDSGYWDDHYAGDRVRTFLVYLTTPLTGGGTHFRALDVLVEARERRLVAWENLFPDGTANHSMIHSGTPLGDGEKTTLVTWERERRFRPEAAMPMASKEVLHP